MHLSAEAIGLAPALAVGLVLAHRGDPVSRPRLVAGALGVALVFAAFAIRVLKPEWLQWYNTLAFSGLACTLLYILSQWREVARSFSGRQTRYGSLAAGSVVVVLVILVAINYLANRHNKRWDLTAAKQFSLSDQTKKVVTGLQKPVMMRVFDRSDGMERFRDRLDEYANVSKQVKVEYIDVERKPQVANQYQVQVAGTVVIEYEGRTDWAKGLAKGPIMASLGDMERRYGVNLDENSHGQSFLKLFRSRFVPDGLYLLDEPEAPLSPRSQLALISMIGDMLTDGAQFIIATHSPILLGYPGATIYSCHQAPMERVEYEELDHVVITRDFLNARERFLKYL